MAWDSSKTTNAIDCVSATGVDYGDEIGLNPNERCHLQWERTDSGSIDGVIISIETTLDDSAELWDVEPYATFTVLAADGDDISFTVSRIYRFRVKIDGAGTTDTVEGNLHYRKDGVSL